MNQIQFHDHRDLRISQGNDYKDFMPVDDYWTVGSYSRRSSNEDLKDDEVVSEMGNP